MKAVIIVPNWNGVEFLDECLTSLEKQYLKAEILVVDNASTDGSQELVRTKHPKVTLLVQPKNRGFAGGVNIGIRYALKQEADYVALFNNDAVADKDWLKKLLAAIESDAHIGTATPKLLHFDGKKLDSTGDFYSSWGFAFPRGRDEVDSGQYDTTDQREVFCGSGGASLYRAEMLRQVGEFDEDFFAYFEDVDLGFRAQLAGWRAVYVPEARAYHHIGGTSSKVGDFARYHTVKNVIHLYTKNMPGVLYWKYLPKFTVGMLLMLAADIKRGRFGLLLRAYWAALILLPGMLVKRWRIQRGRTVSSAYIDSMLYHKMPPTQRTLLGLRQKIATRMGR